MVNNLTVCLSVYVERCSYEEHGICCKLTSHGFSVWSSDVDAPAVVIPWSGGDVEAEEEGPSLFVSSLTEGCSFP